MKIHYCDGVKGGVGKSFFFCVMLQWFIDKKIQFVPVEGDRYNPDGHNRYKSTGLKFEFCVFSDDKEERSADKIWDLAIDKPVVVSLPSQVGNPLDKWLDAALVDAEENKIEFVRWFLCANSYESMRLLKEALQRHGHNVKFVLVRNWGIEPTRCKWEALEDSELKKLLKQCEVVEMNLPELPSIEALAIRQNGWTFDFARTTDELPGMSRSRVKVFLSKAYEALESTKLLP